MLRYILGETTTEETPLGKEDDIVSIDFIDNNEIENLKLKIINLEKDLEFFKSFVKRLKNEKRKIIEEYDGIIFVSISILLIIGIFIPTKLLTTFCIFLSITAVVLRVTEIDCS
jgi:dimeric dUTPase (all-alpha-NTP-PPase superfamily)